MYPVYLVTCFHPSYGQYIMPYVGCVITPGKTVQDRFVDHCHDGHSYLYNAIKKHGKKWFQVEQIDAGNTPEQAFELEKWWIKRLGVKRPNGYNLTDGGEGTSGAELPTVSESNRRRAGETRPPRPDLVASNRAGITGMPKGKKRPRQAEIMRAKGFQKGNVYGVMPKVTDAS